MAGARRTLRKLTGNSLWRERSFSQRAGTFAGRDAFKYNMSYTTRRIRLIRRGRWIGVVSRGG